MILRGDIYFIGGGLCDLSGARRPNLKKHAAPGTRVTGQCIILRL